MHTIKLCSLTNLIRQKFGDLAVILAITVYERCTQVFSVAKTQGSSTSFSLSYHSAISENLSKGYFFTARVDFGVAFSINLLFSADILGFRKALEHNANKIIKIKKVGLLLSTESVNTLKPANSWLDSVVW